MPSTPTSKSQVQAYRFVLRRMESALVRKDPVMLHDPMRSHKRSTIVGAILGVVGLVVFLLIGVLNPAPPVPPSGIVIAEPSGTVYVVSQNPHEFIPVFNLASARLLLAAATAQQQQQSGSATNSAPTVQQPTTVSDKQLDSMPMGRMTGIPDGPTMLPNPGAGPTDWAVCDKIQRDPDALNQTSTTTPPETAVLVGQPNIGTNLAVGQALLVSSDHGATLWLVYGLVSTVNNRDDSAVRARIDSSKPAVLAGLQIADPTQYRQISAAVLNAIPRVADIEDPADGLDPNAAVAPALATLGLRIGQSFSVQEVGEAAPLYYMVVPNGRQLVSETTAQIARYANSGNQALITQVPPEDVTSVPVVTNGLAVNVSQYPGPVPTVITADAKPVVCLGWHADYSDRQNPLSETRVTVDFDLELPADPDSSTGHMSMVQIGQTTSAGAINYFFMNPSLGGVAVRSASTAKEFGSGPIYVIDPRGLAFSVPDLYTAQVLGVADGTASGDVPPAPKSIVDLLPLGGQPLSVQAVQKTFDGMDVPDSAGQYMTPTAQPGN